MVPQLGKRSRSAKFTWKAGKKSKIDKENVPPPGSRRARKLKQWSDESMIKAIDAVKCGQMGVKVLQGGGVRGRAMDT